MTDERFVDSVADGLIAAEIRFGADAIPTPGGVILDSASSLVSEAAPNDTVCAVLTNDRPSVELLLAAMTGGSRLVSLPLPSRGGDAHEYAELLCSICRRFDVHQVVIADRFADSLNLLDVDVRAHSSFSTGPVVAPGVSGFELVQFSSGTTGPPSPCVIGDRELGANVQAILQALEPEPGDNLVSWLPLSHDMGLIGMLLTALVALGPSWCRGGEISLLDPETFLARPHLWLQALSELGGTFTAAPDFGYRLAMARAMPGSLNLSRLRCALVGGEIIRPSTLEGFSAAFGPSGFHETAFCPSYGMAEIGLATSVTRLSEHWELLGRGNRPGLGEYVGSEVVGKDLVVGSGRPLDGYEIRAEVATGGYIGRLAVKGPSIGKDDAGASLADSSGWLKTGDLGVVVDGRVFVMGRDDDYLVLHGRNVFAPAIEDAVGRLDGIREGRVAALATPSGDYVIVAERRNAPAGPDRTATLLRDIQIAAVRVAGVRPVEVRLDDGCTLPFTPSGKLQRARAARMLE